MAGKGGARAGAGRKTKADEEKVNFLFVKALKLIYHKDEDDDAKISFIKELAESTRGQIFIAEHIFGKPKDIVDNTHTILDGFDIKKLYDKEA
jgi:hypothetical protein